MIKRKDYIKEYSCWNRIKSRCLNPTDRSYSLYAPLGMDNSFVNSFEKFIEEIGKMPDYDTKWTVDRINGNLGYVKGNIRWATIEQQVRNRRKPKSNTSGVVGVMWRVRHGCTSAVCTWYENIDGEMKKKSKWFSVKKLGILPAFAKAVEHRNMEIKRLNNLGYGYTDMHGTDKVNYLTEIT